MRADKSIKKLNGQLLKEIKQVLKTIKGWGSIEIFIQDNKVTQITSRNIKKTNHQIEH
jgi:hypothetical protein